jgi:hypothetical protein
MKITTKEEAEKWQSWVDATEALGKDRITFDLSFCLSDIKGALKQYNKERLDKIELTKDEFIWLRTCAFSLSYSKEISEKLVKLGLLTTKTVGCTDFYDASPDGLAKIELVGPELWEVWYKGKKDCYSPHKWEKYCYSPHKWEKYRGYTLGRRADAEAYALLKNAQYSTMVFEARKVV